MKTVTTNYKLHANLAYGTAPIILARIFYGDATLRNIIASTNASPIEITIISHQYSTGDSIWVTGHTTNTRANGCWIITNTGANTFSLNGSAGNGVGGASGTAVRSIFASTRKVQVERATPPPADTLLRDIYKPYVMSFGSIGYQVTEAPGMGSRSNCEITLRKTIFAESGGGTETAVGNLLTQKSKGKKVQLWQFFDDGVLAASQTAALWDTDKLPLASFIIDEVSEIDGATLKLQCISSELLLGKEVPTLKFDIATFPSLLKENIGFPRPVKFGNLKYPSGAAAGANQQKEYIFLNKPINSPGPAYLTDILDFKFVIPDQ